jgi:hypothetical protein
MRRVPIVSISIASIGYEADSRVLEIEFRESGKVYRYFDVPPGEYEAFLQSPSKGSYLNQTLKNRGYLYERVR